MTTHAHAHESAKAEHKPAEHKTTKVDITDELVALTQRIGQYRVQLKHGGAGQFNHMHLADLEFMLVELNKARGKEDAMTPAEVAELNDLIELRKLPEMQQAVWDRLSGKHGEFTPEELVERDYLMMQQDKKMSEPQLARYKELMEKAGKGEKGKK